MHAANMQSTKATIADRPDSLGPAPREEGYMARDWDTYILKESTSKRTIRALTWYLLRNQERVSQKVAMHQPGTFLEGHAGDCGHD
jgi:hypothetical protein